MFIFIVIIKLPANFPSPDAQASQHPMTGDQSAAQKHSGAARVKFCSMKSFLGPPPTDWASRALNRFTTPHPIPLNPPPRSLGRRRVQSRTPTWPASEIRERISRLGRVAECKAPAGQQAPAGRASSWSPGGSENWSRGLRDGRAGTCAERPRARAPAGPPCSAKRGSHLLGGAGGTGTRDSGDARSLSESSPGRVFRRCARGAPGPRHTRGHTARLGPPRACLPETDSHLWPPKPDGKPGKGRRPAA